MPMFPFYIYGTSENQRFSDGFLLSIGIERVQWLKLLLNGTLRSNGYQTNY